MANELQNSLLAAIDTVVGQRIEELELDKTVIGSIEQLVDANTNKYRVQYKGGSMIAYAQSKEVYNTNTSVYISIPQNDFSKKKWIIGKVSTADRDTGRTEISAALEDYQLVGNNTITLINQDNHEFGLCSYKKEESKILYTRNQPNENVLQIDETKLKQYLDTSKALLIEATFRTDLSSVQKTRVSADYGLIFNLVFEHGDATYPTMLDKFNALAPQIKIKQLQDNYLSLMKCDEDVRTIVYQWDGYTSPVITLPEAATKLSIVLASVAAMKDKYSPRENELIESYHILLEKMIEFAELGSSNWCSLYHEWFEQKTNTLINKKIIYSFDTNSMVGNPLLFRFPTEQYNIYPIDTGRFKYIEDIVFFCSGFEENSGLTENDIFVSDIELYGLQELSAINGNYRLNLGFLQGQIFDEPTVSENGEIIQPNNLSVEAKLFYQSAELNTNIDYYWFIKDGRVKDASHENYHMRGGIGWRYFDKVDDKTLTLSSLANTAYENIYKCIAVYNSETTLKAEFSIYNNANRREIVIESDLGTSFKFDSGIPTLTCKILEPFMEETEPISVPLQYKDTEYSYEYLWMRKDQQNQVVVLDKTYEELKEEYENSGFSAQLLLQSKLSEMENVTLDKNVLQYPVSKIASNTSVVFECYVYRKEVGKNDVVYVGCGLISLVNEAAAALNEYYIIIENGDQVFQYTESGVSPCNERFQDPVAPKELVCHLYDPNGLEVNPSQYSVKWEYPLDNSLIIPPDDLKVNPSNGLQQWFYGINAPVQIIESYDYSALNNQIKCIVKYDTIEVVKNSSLYFGKIGDNGTNGTDVVAKIEPWITGNGLDNEPLTLISSFGRSYWNSGLSFNMATTPLELKLFRRNDYINPTEYKNVKWSIAGGRTKSNRLMADANLESPHLASITAGSAGNSSYSNYIIKGEAKLDKIDGNEGTQTHYAFYPVCIIDYANGVRDMGIAIDKNKTLKHILYNADGRNPVYNENQGVFFNFSITDPELYHVSWEAKGGLEKEENLPAFDIFYDKDIILENGSVISANTPSNSLEGCPYIWIKPKDVYSGAAQNNHVKASIFKTEVGEQVLIATVYVPIYMSLNLYGLASLNAWDGNTIEINEDNNYIMAPQIGAGVKNEDNTFTGIVMGKATTYGDEEEQVGLLGYSSGRQSIFLDAETGNATFGLPEQDERDPNQYNKNEGRVELRPGGLSSIAKWKFNSRALFNVPEANPENSEDYNTWGGLTDPYEDLQKYNYGVDEEHQYLKSIPHDKGGILLGSQPSYISIKGRPLTMDDNINYTQASTIVRPGDTFELQLDPNQSSLFTIYRHTTMAKNPNLIIKGSGQNVHIGIRVEDTGEEGVEVEEDTTQYSTPVFDSSTGDIIGWNALVPDPVNKEYVVAIKENLNSDGSKFMWLIKAVKNPGYYSLAWFADKKNDPSVWRREPRVGIDSQGRFYTNALKNSTSSLVINEVGAFGSPADSAKYIGASFEVGPTEDESYSLIKMFTYAGENNTGLENPSGALYISGSSDIENEYLRPMRLYGEAITLLADSNKNNTIRSQNRIKISDNFAFVGYSGDDNQTSDEENNPTIGSYLFFNKKDKNRLYSDHSFETLIATNQNANEPWLFTNEKFAIPVGGTYDANQVTRLPLGSIVNYTFSNGETDITDSSTGHILNYATGSLQLNKAKQLTEKITDNDGNVIPATYGIDKALQINDNDILFGNVDTFEHAENDSRESWGAELDVHDYTIGNIKLHSNITKGFQFIGDGAGTTLASAPRIGLYSNDGIDIQELSGKGLYLGSSDDEDASYLLLKPNVDEDTSVMLRSEHGYLEFNGNARKNLHGTGASNGAYIDPGLHTGYGIFNGPIAQNGTYNGFSIYADKKIKAEDLDFHSTLSLSGSGGATLTSANLKTLLGDHTHPFSKTVYVRPSDIGAYLGSYSINISCSYYNWDSDGDNSWYTTTTGTDSLSLASSTSSRINQVSITTSLKNYSIYGGDYVTVSGYSKPAKI